MSEQLKILPVKTSVQLVADGSRTEFTFPFGIFSASDVEVYIDDKKTVGSFNVNGIGNSNGGSVVFAQAPAAAAVITIRRNLPIERLTDFQESSELRAAALNNELDYLTACVQQISDDLSRCVGMTPTDYSASLALPPKSSRSDKLLGFDADGNVIAVVPSGKSEAIGWKNLDDIPAGTEFQHLTTPEKSKLETVQSFAAPNPPQVSAQEKTSGIESELRSHSPRDIRDIVLTHAPAPTIESVFGRTGIITALAGDYTADKITDTAAKVVMTAAERTKLTGIQTGAQVNAPQVSAAEKTAGTETQLRSNSPRDIRDMVLTHAPAATIATVFGRTGTITALAGDYTADKITDTAAKVVMTAAERTKLTSIEAGAQVNAPQVSAAEKTAGTETQARSFSPSDIKDIASAVTRSSSSAYFPPIVSVADSSHIITLSSEQSHKAVWMRPFVESVSVTLRVPSGLPADFTCQLVNDTKLAVSIVPYGVGVALVAPGGTLPVITGQYERVFLTPTPMPDTWCVDGDLVPA
jgi:hypothetical protein